MFKLTSSRARVGARAQDLFQSAAAKRSLMTLQSNTADVELNGFKITAMEAD